MHRAQFDENEKKEPTKSPYKMTRSAVPGRDAFYRNLSLVADRIGNQKWGGNTPQDVVEGEIAFYSSLSVAPPNHLEID